MKIVITGSEGFIGSKLKDCLKEHELDLYDLKINRNIKDFSLKGDEDFVIHLAAKTGVRESIKYKDLYYLHNYLYSKNIFDLCTAHKIRCIYASSSCAVFPDKSPYGMSKKLAEDYGQNHIGLRFTNVFGMPPRENMLLDKIIKGNLKYITTHKRDFIFIEDVCKAIKIFLNKDKQFNSIYNVSYGISYNIVDLINLLNLSVPIKQGHACEVDDNCLDNSELKLLNWAPSIDIKEFLKNYFIKSTALSHAESESKPSFLQEFKTP